MSDSLGDLKVRFTGDAAQLAATISEVQGQLSEMQSDFKGASSAADSFSSSTKKGANALEQYKAKLAAVEKQQKAFNIQEGFQNIQNVGKNIGEIGKGIDTVTKPLQSASVLLAAGGVAASKFAIDFENDFAAVKKTVEGTPEQLKAVKQGIIDLTTTGIEGRSAIPATTAQLTELAAAGGQLGIETQNIVKFTEVMAQMGSATNLSGEYGAQVLAKFMNIMKVDQGLVRNLGSAIVDLGNNHATTEADIASMSLRLGRTANVVGISAQDTLGYATALSSLGIEAEAGGSAVSRTWTKIQNAVSEGGEGLSTFASISGVSADEFKKAWNSDPSSAFNMFIKGLSQSEDMIADLQEVEIKDVRESDAMKALAKGYDLVSSALERANTAWEENTALQKEADNMAQTTAGQIQITINNIVEAARSIGETFLPIISKGSGTIKDFASGIANMSQESKKRLVDVTTGIITFGAGAKVLSSTAKGIGGFVEGIGKMGTAITGLAAAHPIILATAAGITALAAAGAGIYYSYEKAQYEARNFGKACEEGNDEMQKQIRSANELASVLSEHEELSININSGNLNSEELEKSKQKLEEINQYLINDFADSLSTESLMSGIVTDEDIARLKELVELKKEAAVIEQQNTLIENKEKFDNAQEELPKLTAKRDAIVKNNTELEKERNILSKNLNEWERVSDSAEYKNKSAAEQAQIMNSALEKMNTELEKENISSHYDGFGYVQRDLELLNKEYDDNINKIKEYKTQIDEYSKSDAEYRQASRAMVDTLISSLPDTIPKGSEAVKNTVEQIGTYGQNAKLTFNEMGYYAQQTALKLNGFGSAAEMTAKGIDKTRATVNDCINTMQSWGYSAAQAAIEGALLQNGFDNIEAAAAKGGLQTAAEQANELAHSLGLLPDNQNIRVNAEATGFEVIDEAENVLERFNGKTAECTLNLETKGEDKIDGLKKLIDSMGGEETFIMYLEAQDNATFTINDVRYKLMSYSKDEHKAILKAEDGATYVIDLVEGKLKKLDKIEAKPKITVQKFEETASANKPILALPNAKGTSDFKGGLARINDEKGVSDPRELVEFGGKGYIFEGRDVILPLPKHSKVYTAAQTKEIMSAKGIPHYASGKNNEDWENAKSDREHIRNTAYSIIPAAAELEWLESMKNKFAADAEVIKEINEDIVSYTKQMWKENLDAMQYSLDMGWQSEEEYYSKLAVYRDENFAPDTEEYKDATLKLHKYSVQLIEDANDVSKAWTDMRNTFNDWDEIGDSPLSAYQRINERNLQAVEDGKQTYQEYLDLMNDTTKIISDRADYSFNWIDHAQKYEALDADGTIAGLNRIQTYVDEFFSGLGELTEEQYAIKLDLDTTLADKKMEAYADKMSEWEEGANWYQKNAEVYGWENMNDSEIDFYQRKIDKYTEFANDPDLSKNERQNALRGADEARLELYKATESKYDELLDLAKEKMDDVEKLLNEKLSALETKWEVEDRAEDKAETLADIEKYKNAVTIEGKEKYNELVEHLKEIERDEQRYELEQENNAIMERLKEDYERLEEEKKNILEQTRLANQNIAGMLEPLESEITSNMDILASRIEAAIKEIKPSITYTQQNYITAEDNTDYTLFTNKSFSQTTEFLGG